MCLDREMMINSESLPTTGCPDDPFLKPLLHFVQQRCWLVIICRGRQIIGRAMKNRPACQSWHACRARGCRLMYYAVLELMHIKRQRCYQVRLVRRLQSCSLYCSCGYNPQYPVSTGYASPFIQFKWLFILADFMFDFPVVVLMHEMWEVYYACRLLRSWVFYSLKLVGT